MLLFFFVFFISRISAIYSELDEQNTYIDQLQEPDKKEFLERIVRRIAGEIDLKGVPVGESKNISDAELEKHSDYVKKVINEEKAKFENKDDKELPSKNNSSINHSNIDFTLKEQRRRKRNQNSDNAEATTKAIVTIAVKAVYDSSKELDPVKKSRPNGKDDIQVKGLRPKLRRSTHTDDSKINTDKVLFSDKPKDNHEETSLVTEGNGVNKSTVNSGLENDSIRTLITTTEAENSNVRFITSDDIRQSETSESELSNQKKDAKDSHDDKLEGSLGSLEPEVNETVDISNKNEETITINTDKTIEINNVTEKKILSDNNNVEKSSLRNGTKQSDKIPDNKIKLNATEPSTINISGYIKRTDKNDDQENGSKVSNSSNSEDNQENGPKVSNLYNSEDKQKETLNKTSVTSLEINKSSPKLELKIKKSTGVSEEIKTLQIAQDVVKALRIGIDRDAMKNRNKNIRTKSKLSTNNVNVYGLYDITEENSHDSLDNIEEQPYYAPVYNYFASNAYYSGYNKYGPNSEDYKALEDNSQFVKPHSIDVSDISGENSNRAFYKTPSFEYEKHRTNDHKVTIRDNIYPVLPSVVNKPSKLPQYDYDYVFEKSDLRNQKQVKDSEVYLKSRIKNIRQSIMKHDVINGKRGKTKSKKGWLSNSVEYYAKPNRAKSRQKLYQQIQNIDYDYLGDHLYDRFATFDDNLAMSDVLHSKIDYANSKNARAKNREVVANKKKGKKNPELKYKILEVYPLLKKLVKIVEFEEDVEVEACIRVMGDLIQTDNDGLEQYDWLESTVNIQSAVEKLSDLTAAAISREKIHPSDLELLKYTTYLYSISKTNKDEPINTRSILPKSNMKIKKKNKMKSFNVWLYRTQDPGLEYEFDYNALQKFLEELADNLYDLHDAIKHISMVTTLKNQHWFKNLKELYLRKPNRKQLLELVLHLGTTRLFNLIEDSSKKGIEKDFLKYIEENQVEVSRIHEAFVFVLKVLEAALDNKLIENY